MPSGNRALAIFEELGDLVGQSNVLNNLGTAAFYQGRWLEALDLYQRAAEVCARAGDTLRRGQPLNNMAEIFIDQGKVAEAEEVLSGLRTSWGKIPYPFGVAVATLNLGRAALRGEDFTRAASLFYEAQELFMHMDSWYYLSECQLSMLELRLRTRSVADDVADVARVTHDIDAREGDPYLAYPLARLRAVALARAGDVAGAVEVVSESVNRAEVAGYLFDLAAGLRLRTSLVSLVGEEPQAEDRSRSENLFASLGVVSPPDWDLTPA